MRARTREIGAFEGARFAVANSLAGTGEPLPSVPGDLEEALTLTESLFGRKSARMLVRFAELPDSSLLWTRTGEDQFRIGYLAGPWRYESSEEALRVGICQVRPARWLPDGFNHATVPPAVSMTFARGGKNLQRISERSAEEFSHELIRAEAAR